MHKFTVEFWGVRGSSSASSPDKMGFGCNTSCVFVVAGEEKIILDMGTGAVLLGERFCSRQIDRASILLSHFHYDHLEGLPFFAPFFRKGSYKIYSEGRENQTVEQLLAGLMKPPFFPVSPEIFGETLSYCTFEENNSFFIGPSVQIQTIHAHHPGVSTAYRITFDKRSMVYLVDHESLPENETVLADFCQNADLVIYDAPYTEDEYIHKFKGWGHSTYQSGLRMAKLAQAKKIVFTHHASSYTDEELAQREQYIQTLSSNASFARQGMVLDL